MANKENIKTWVAALRSDEFEQGREYLAKDGKYCCLGVACELAIRGGIPVVAEFCNCGECDPVPYRYDGDTAVLPSSVRDWLGLDERDPYGIYNGERHKLSKLNDDGGFNFKDLADIIERTYLAGESDSWWDKEKAGVAA